MHSHISVYTVCCFNLDQTMRSQNKVTFITKLYYASYIVIAKIKTETVKGVKEITFSVFELHIFFYL